MEEMPPPTTDSSSPAAAAPTPQPNLADADGKLQMALQRRGSLNLHDVELRAALFMISEQWGINIVCGKVEGTVNGIFRNAPLREILDSILLSNGYNYRAVGESLVVSTVAELGQINPFFQSATIPVRSADIDEVVQGAKLLSTPQGQVQPIKSAHSIVVLDFPDRVKMIREFVASIDRASNGGVRAGEPFEVGYFRTQHISCQGGRRSIAGRAQQRRPRRRDGKGRPPGDLRSSGKHRHDSNGARTHRPSAAAGPHQGADLRHQPARHQGARDQLEADHVPYGR